MPATSHQQNYFHKHNKEKNNHTMGIVIGIDVGGSTTKIVGLNEGEIISPMFITATDPVSSLFGAFGKYIYSNNISLSDIEHVMITGVGSAYVEGNIYGLPTTKADEFQSDGLGAHFGSKLEKLIVVSMGTGTTLIQVEGDKIRYLGGLGMGGGTLMGLSSLLLKTTNIDTIQELAERGNVKNVNLQIEDICKNDLEGLPLYATASLFGKVANSHACDEDIAIGIYYLVIQTIGCAAVLSALNSGIKDIVPIGNLAQIPQCRTIFKMIEDLYKVRFHIPEHAEFRTAIGAALCYRKA